MMISGETIHTLVKSAGIPFLTRAIISVIAAAKISSALKEPNV